MHPRRLLLAATAVTALFLSKPVLVAGPQLSEDDSGLALASETIPGVQQQKPKDNGDLTVYVTKTGTK
jgi:hypothetical protein